MQSIESSNKGPQFPELLNDLEMRLEQGEEFPFDELDDLHREVLSVLVSANKAEFFSDKHGFLHTRRHRPGIIRRLITFGINS